MIRTAFPCVALSVLLLLLSFTCPNADAYPLDAFQRTGIKRLEGYFYSLHTQSGQEAIPRGALLNEFQIELRLVGEREPLLNNDAEFKKKILSILGSDAGGYSFAVLDLSIPEHPLYAEHKGREHFNPGSIGKIVVALAVMQELADLYPGDIEARKRVLRQSMVTADSFILTDSHEVPFWHLQPGDIEFRPLEIGDTANLWEYLDFMISASSNAAANMVIRELILIRHFGRAYPPSDQEREEFFRKSSPGALQRIVVSVLQGAVSRNGLDPRSLRQGSMFTRQGRGRIPSAGSYATVRELLRYLLLIEQGKLVDQFSSLELKKLLYLTQKRIRYASQELLIPAAVYYKSGSNYRCRPEAGFGCGKFRGNLENTMNSVAIVEYPADDPEYFYLVTLNSNVLRKDSSEQHRALAALIQRLIEERKDNYLRARQRPEHPVQQ